MSNECTLVQLGANERDAPSTINLDVSGTTGPDYLGQQTVDVDGHSKDRPGVRCRAPESDPNDSRIAQMDTGEELPVLLSSDMSHGPIEGTQGSYTEIVEGECDRCGYDRIKVTRETLAGETKEVCNACGYYQTRERMPTTDKARAKRERESGQKLGELLSRDVYDMESDTGMGPYVSLVGSNTITRIRKDEVADMFAMIYDPRDMFDVLVDQLGPIDEVLFAKAWQSHLRELMEDDDE